MKKKNKHKKLKNKKQTKKVEVKNKTKNNNMKKIKNNNKRDLILKSHIVCNEPKHVTSIVRFFWNPSV